MRSLILLAALTLGVLLMARQIAEAISFTYTTFDVPGALDTYRAGINSRGQIIGGYTDSSGGGHSFLYDKGVFKEIAVPFLGASHTSPSGINDSGEIVGTFIDSSGHGHGFLDDRGVFTQIDVPGVSNFTEAAGINSDSQRL